MSRRQNWPRFFIGWLRLLRRDLSRSSRRLIVVRRTKRNHHLQIKLNRPRLGRSRWYWRRRWQQIPWVATVLRDITSFGLIVASIAGIIYLSEPFRDQPVFYAATTEQVQSTAVKPGNTALTRGLNRSLPTKLIMPTLGVKTRLIQLGRRADGSLATPDNPNEAGWYKFSPTPGEVGPAVIVGHVDSDSGPAVFYRLHKLNPGRLIEIDRRDGSHLKFTVYRVAHYSQSHFPTKTVYGNTARPELRLITCGGPFNYVTGHYTENTVVFASYVSG